MHAMSSTMQCPSSTAVRVYFTKPRASHAPQPMATRVVSCSAAPQPQTRRGLLAGVGVGVGLATMGLERGAQAAEAPTLTQYTDSQERFSISVPAGWEFGEGGLDGNSSFSGASGTRRVVGWYSPSDPATNAVVVITTIGADYTSMGSMGSAYDFGSNLVGSMDRSYLLRAPEFVRRREPLIIARLVDSKEISSSPKTYFIEYTVERPNGDNRHLYSVATLGFNGVYNRLYTITAQCDEAMVGSMGRTLEQMVKSFQAPPELQDRGRS